MPRPGFFSRLDERRTRVLLAAFFLALAIPAGVLIAQAYGQLKWQALRNSELLAEDLESRIDADLHRGLAAEEARSFGDYSFLVVEGNAAAGFVQRSPLSAFPVASAIPGAIGYFQVDPDGQLTTPLLPDDGVDPANYGVSAEEARARRALAASIRDVLAENRLVQRPAVETSAPEPAPAAATGSFAPSAALVEKGVSRAQAEPLRRGPGQTGQAASAEQAARGASAARAAARLDEVVPTVREVGRTPADKQAFAPRVAGGTAPLGRDERPARVLAPAVAVASQAVAPSTAPAPPPAEPQQGFDRLAAVDSSKHAFRAPQEGNGTGAPAAKVRASAADAPVNTAAARSTAAERQKRTEQSAVPEPKSEPERAGPSKLEFRVRTFESEVDPLALGLLDTGHLVAFRNVWHDGRRYIQGALIDSAKFVGQAAGQAFRASSLAATNDLVVTYRGTVLGTFGAAGAGKSVSEPSALAGALLHRARLSPPFGDLELSFNVRDLPRAPGSALLGWVTLTLAAVLCGGFLLMYRFAVGQLRLAKQQQDFVSAVSHELKTPLTSIRMYGEMLKAGWADDAKRRVYYDYIHGESERLSRLIENVLQLARLTRNNQRFDRRPTPVRELMDLVRSKVATQVEQAGFVLSLTNEAPADCELVIDADCFTQIIINLVDNALKFSAGADRKMVEISSRRESDGTLLFTVRDFGPGVPKGQMKKIFELFYRPTNELTRETAGTGIGLALVHQLTSAMGGRVDVRNLEPGAEFRLSFPSPQTGS